MKLSSKNSLKIFLTLLALTISALGVKPAKAAGNLVGYWALDDGSGATAADSSGYGHPGALTGGSWSVSHAPTGFANTGSLILDGSTGQGVNITQVTSVTDNLSMSAWANWAGINALGQMLIYNGNSGPNGYGIYLQPNGELSVLNGGVAIASSPTSFKLTVGTWQYIVVMRAAGVWKLYVDGSQVALNANPVPNPPSGSTSIGRSVINTNTFNGLIDDARIYDRILTATESCSPAITVANANDSGAGSLRQAIAGLCSGGTITFNGDYTILLASQLTVDCDMTIDGAGHNVIVSGNHITRVFNLTCGTINFNKLTIADGYTSSDGGGVYIGGGTLTVTNSTFSGNSGSWPGGGGIELRGGAANVINSTFVGNSAISGGYGGGIDSFSGTTLNVTDSTFFNNSADSAGGGLSVGGTGNIINSTISGNSSGWVGGGGGINNEAGVVTIKNSIITNNPTGNNCFSHYRDLGYVFYGSNNLVDDASCDTSFATNSASILLGALGNYGGSTQTFPLLPGSSAIDSGDHAICAAAPVSNLDQRGVTRPAACDVGAFESQGFTLAKTGGDGQSTIANTAFANPLALSVTGEFGEPVDGGAVIFTPPDSGASAATSGSPAKISGGAASVSATANGTAGSYNVVTSAAGAASVNFALTNTPACADSVTVASNADSGAGSLRQAISDVCAGGTIDFDAAMAGQTITLTSGQLTIDKSLTIDGLSTSPGVTVSGNNATRAFYVNNGVTATLNKLTIANGKMNGIGPLGYGGGILNDGDLTITNSTLADNNATNGGGIFNNAGRTLTVANSTFSNNSATGGAIYINAGSPITITNSTLSGNSGSAGGGIVNWSATTTVKNTIIANSISVENCYSFGVAFAAGSANNLADDATCGASFTNSDSILLSALGNHGGGTLTVPLLPGSAAINAGDSAACAAAPVSGLDQRGITRPQGIACDIGAYEAVLSSNKAIIAFNFTTPVATGVVTEAAHTISLTVPYGTDVTALVPTITHTGASISPLSGEAQNFTSPVPYTVTAEDASTQVYTVTVTVALNPAKAITAFNFTTPAATGVVTEAAHTIALTVPYGTNVTALVPTITHTGARVSPDSGVAQDFSSPVTYTVTAEDASTQDYSVTVTVNPSTNANLSALVASTGAFSPVFDPATITYTQSVANAITDLTVTPTSASVGATIQVRINGGAWSAVPSGSPTTALSLDPGTNPIDVQVTAADGITTKTYTNTVARMFAVPSTVSPAGTITDTHPTYVWNAVSGATLYDLYVYSEDNSGYVVSTTSLSASSICSADTCSYTPAVSLTGIDYFFKVRGKSITVTGPFSPYRYFSVGVIPAAPTTLSPTGMIAETQPTYVWNAVTGATYYDLYVYSYNSASYVVSATFLPASSICFAGTCSYTPTVTLTSTDYFFKVNARNFESAGPYSPYRYFTVGTAPAAPTTVSPTGTISETTPTYVWNAISGATWYDLYVYSYDSASYVVSTTSLFASSICSAGTCSYTPAVSLTGIDYFFKVRARNVISAGSFSPYQKFAVGVVPVAPTTVSPTGTSSDTTPTYVWNAVSGATYYNLYVYSYDTSSYVVSATFLPASTTCSGSTCSYTPAVGLTGIDYFFKVNARNIVTPGPYSPYQKFAVGVVPVAPATISPTGTISETQPAYIWNAVAGASQYDLYVYLSTSSSAVVSATSLPASTTCSGGTCSYTPATALVNGIYKFRVRAKNIVSSSPYSAYRYFTVSH